MLLCDEIIDNIMIYYKKSYLISKKYYLLYKNKNKKALNKIIEFLKEIKKERTKFRYITIGNYYNLSKKDLIKRVIYNYNYDTFVGYPEIIVGAFNLDVCLLDILPKYEDRKIFHLYNFLKQEEISKDILMNARY